MKWLPTGFRRPSGIGLRLLAFNLLVVFVPVTGVVYLDVYETQLRQVQEAGLAQQARILAAVLGDRPALDKTAIDETFARLERRSDARLRVYGPDGALLADSARETVATAVSGAPGRSASVSIDDHDVRRHILYRIGAWVVKIPDWLTSRVARVLGRSKVDYSKDVAPDATPPEVRAALEGRYGAAIRVTGGQRSVTFFSAVPVRHAGVITGAVVVSQSTLRLLLALYDIRLRTVEIVVASLLAAAFLTAVAAKTIVGPLGRLRRQATALADRRGTLPGIFPGAARKDEIGELARALGELSRRTNDHIELLQSFSADVSHELKNPLASIRTAAEMMAEAESPEERRRFQDLMVRDVARLERLVSGLRDVARVEGQIEADVSEPVGLRELLSEHLASLNATAPNGIHLDLVPDGGAPSVLASPERLSQVFENMLANAISFSPAGGAIVVTLAGRGDWAVVTIEDSGPGIPEGHLDRVFQRFFSYRPGDARREHVGLGLAIAKQIVESYGGRISASNRRDGGASFEVRLPRLTPRASRLANESARRR